MDGLVPAERPEVPAERTEVPADGASGFSCASSDAPSVSSLRWWVGLGYRPDGTRDLVARVFCDAGEVRVTRAATADLRAGRVESWDFDTSAEATRFALACVAQLRAAGWALVTGLVPLGPEEDLACSAVALHQMAVDAHTRLLVELSHLERGDDVFVVGASLRHSNNKVGWLPEACVLAPAGSAPAGFAVLAVDGRRLATLSAAFPEVVPLGRRGTAHVDALAALVGVLLAGGAGSLSVSEVVSSARRVLAQRP